MYLLDGDVDLVVDHFNSDRAVAWLVGMGPGRWRAVARLDQVPPARIGLWHEPSGPLPLLASPEVSEPDGQVTDPWAGWAQRRPGSDRTPYFGAGHPGVYWLNVRTTGQGAIGMSSVEWIGNHYRIIGRPAAPQTERHWQALRRWAGRLGEKVPRTGPVDGPGKEIFAFPAALAAIRAGRSRAANPL
jgi:hypothetical protein